MVAWSTLILTYAGLCEEKTLQIDAKYPDQSRHHIARARKVRQSTPATIQCPLSKGL